MANKIKLCACGEPEQEVPTNMHYPQRADVLVRISRKLRMGGREKEDKDDKFLITEDGLASLLGAGADIVELNVVTCGKTYVSRVVYSGRTFVHASRVPVAYIIESNLR